MFILMLLSGTEGWIAVPCFYNQLPLTFSSSGKTVCLISQLDIYW